MIAPDHLAAFALDHPTRSHFVQDDKGRVVEYKVVHGPCRHNHRVLRWLGPDRALLDRTTVATKLWEARG